VCSFFLPEKTFAPVMSAEWMGAPRSCRGGRDEYDGAFHLSLKMQRASDALDSQTLLAATFAGFAR